MLRQTFRHVLESVTARTCVSEVEKKLTKCMIQISQIPWVDWLWMKIPILQRYGSVKRNRIFEFGIARVEERRRKIGFKNDDGEITELNDRDFLSRFLQAMEKDPSIPPFALIAWVTSNVTAGSDTTAIMLRTIFYNLLKHPDSMARLKDELDTHELSNVVTWKEARELPPLDACIKEAGRLHPPFGLPLERVVPPEGANICGTFLPGHCVVGMNGFTVHRHAATFGDDCDVWRPSRWLCDDQARRKMENALFTFGSGSRTCLGKHISQLEVYKLVPSIIKHFRVSYC